MLLNSSIKLFKIMHVLNSSSLRCLSTEMNAQNILVDVLGMREEVAKIFIVKNKIDELETDKLHDTVAFLKKQKYKLIDIIRNPKIFNPRGSKTWNHYYDYFKECGCKQVPITNILNFRKIRYSTIASLKEQGILPQDAVVAQNLINQLDQPLPEDQISDLKDDNLMLSYIHRTVTHRYLVNKLGATNQDLEQICRLHSIIYNKSLKAFCENINIALELGFTPEKILRNAYILQANPYKTKEVLEQIPNFLNCDMKVKMRHYPKLIGLSVAHFNKIYKVLKTYELSDDTISKAMNIFTLSQTTIEERLNDLKSTPETRVLMNNPQILQLLIHYHKAKDRLQFLHKVRLKCASLMVIGFSERIFDAHIQEGKDVNKRKEANNFLCALLECTKNDVAVNFKRHPFYLYVPFLEIERTYRFLKSNRFENEHILKAITILLYPPENIAQVLEIIRTDHYLSTHKPRVSKVQILNLALYYLEKDHHFTGNGVWRMNDDYEST